jgi:hypothetical protein
MQCEVFFEAKQDVLIRQRLLSTNKYEETQCHTWQKYVNIW